MTVNGFLNVSFWWGNVLCGWWVGGSKRSWTSVSESANVGVCVCFL